MPGHEATSSQWNMASGVNAMTSSPLFSVKLPGLRLRHDATSLTAAWTCPQKYLREMVQGLRLAGGSKHLVFGQGLHAGLEALHNARWANKPAEECLNAAIKAALSTVGWRDGQGDDSEWHPWMSADKKKNLHSLVRALVWYADDLARGEGGEINTWTINQGLAQLPLLKPATEVYWEAPLGVTAVTGEEYWLCGNLDRVVEWDGELWVLECKTTGSDISERYWEGWNPSIQVKTYDLGLSLAKPEWQLAGVAMEVHQVGVGFSRWVRMPLRYAAGLRDQWKVQIKDKLREIERWTEASQALGTIHTGKPLNLLQPPASAFPDNYTSCHGFDGGCWLRPVCRRRWQERDELLAGMPRWVWEPSAR